MDADVQLRAKKIIAPKLPIDDLNAKLTLNNGVLSFAPARFGVADGHVEIFSTFDGSKRPSKVKIDARLRQLDVRRFLAKSSVGEKALGPIGGRINLTGTGESFRELMATASGNSFFTMSGGEISELTTQLAGLDVAHALGMSCAATSPSRSAAPCWIFRARMDRWAFKLLSSTPPLPSLPVAVTSICETKK